MNFKEIQELIRQLNKSEISYFKYKNADFEIKIKTGKGETRTEGNVVSYTQPQVVLSPPATVISAPAATETNSQVIEKIAPSSNPPKASEDTSKLLQIKSPMVGTFYRSPSPDKPQFVKVGDKVDVGSTVCIIEAMKLFNEIESEVKGTIVKILVEDATPVEFDQILFLVEP
ncbi:MAG: acetyl-CoA carboxylase biotin carboxyl carrier protein [Saprospiraceae bacterium]|jgi:acetyl-CoA carboxylase biotin carboxyl carrier protein|nr:acetyl-CoA carboxylase biotin carboxyl carrier protein [Saprospiraceae bacterium]MBK7797408.1 acetyl-CoA carboxylase biotin carboxyl carrier protein [Saprospiraceae bacterium]MBK9377225.1 acetyl-CoA carboxylase biotin carboxyl carrier protein [Saprospiraceae bacterium]MBL0261479.1 acetyl-CoA carboxylase biotin carboxyl carrier protein [Saprospiraceae bacterium]